MQEALADDQALLAFQIWRKEVSADFPYDDGSSWVLAVSREGAHADRIPDARALEDSVKLLVALVGRRDGTEAAGAARLYRELLGPALRDLPRRVARLVIVPDGPLHRLPFEALRDSAAAPPLAARYQTSVAPSAALWLRWRRAPSPRARTPALVLVDPSLPFARAEGASAIEALGGGSRLLIGPEASEWRLKTTDLREYGILHFATHAVVDEEKPERSAVLLAPGSPVEDGLLQMRDVARLTLSGQVVVLAACSSSNGPMLRGEGAMSLARAFFEAGARAVVGGLWPLRDDEAASLVSAFYRQLARGQTVAQAMAAARLERIGAGAPAAEWAGLTVLGDGEVAPVAAAPPGAPPARAAIGTAAPWPLAALLAAALGATLLTYRLAARRRRAARSRGSRGR